jgi:hypothetical protein
MSDTLAAAITALVMILALAFVVWLGKREEREP